MPIAPPRHRPAGQATRQQQDVERGSSAARGYDAAWRRLRLAYLRANPLCQCDQCQEGKLQVTAASVVDHIVPISERPELRLQWSNLRSMSKPCHDRHTARQVASGHRGMRAGRGQG